MPRTEPIKAVRGMRDLMPADRALWRTVEKAAARVARSFGYQEMVTPILEHTDLIERVGTDTDAVAKELYRFEDRGGRNLALRPEATAGIVRAYFEGGLNQGPQPARLYLIGPMFRYDRPQKGRYRQFFQFDIEAIGAGSPAVDAEIIELAATWLHEVGLSDLALELNTILDCKVPQCQPFKIKAPRITDHLCAECAAAWVLVRRVLDAAGIEYRLNPYLVRGLDYYTRTVFEFYPGGASGQQDALVAGGRYDDLAEAEGWPSTPGVGFAAGLDRVTEVVAAGGAEVIPEPAAEVVVLADAGLEVFAAEVARFRRIARSVAVDYEPKSLRAKMRSANKLGARWVVLLGAADVERHVAQLKDMATGEQVEEAWRELAESLA